MRRFATRLSLLGIVAALFALPALSASADVPIPVNPVETPGAGPGSWDAGVYVQPVWVAGEVRGEGTVVACHIHVQTTPDGAFETMMAVDGDGVNYADNVRGIWVFNNARAGDPPEAGRATFTVDAGVTLSTTNTDPAVSGTCPGGEQVE